MPTFRCRTLIPKLEYNPWVEVDAASAEDAGQEYHVHRANKDQSLAFYREGEATVYFARVEVEGHEPFISRIFHWGIRRRGGVRRPSPTPKEQLAKIAKTLGWKDDPEDLIAEGWENEQSEWL